MKIRSIRSHTDLTGRKIILRLDLNVPFRGNTILDDYKLNACLPIVRFLLKKNASLIIVSHRGEPEKKAKRSSWTLEPVALWLAHNLKTNITLSSLDWSDISKQAKDLKPKEIMLLENVRLFKGEVENDKAFAKRLARLGDIFVNDAFAVSHRNHASVSAITSFIPSYAGFLLEDEITHLEKARHAKKPLVLIMGGAKISSKLPLMQYMAKQAEYILVGGGIANAILKSETYEIGKSLSDSVNSKIFKKLPMEKIILPLDVVLLRNGKKVISRVDTIQKNDSIFDIGPKTAKAYALLVKDAKTIIWNGPLGKAEDKRFANGTNAIARAIAGNKKAYSVIGGGETVAAAAKTKKQFSWISTGGGASLAYLSGEELPGLKHIIS